MPDDKTILSKYFPEESIPTVHQWLKKWNIQLKITRARNSKLGDYRPPLKQPYHRISVNHDLNKYHFLLTFVHEFAHLLVWEKYKNRVMPHGVEWKTTFRDLMLPLLKDTIFPTELQAVISHYLQNPGASSADTALIKALRKYDTHKTWFTVEDIPARGLFKTQNGMIFERGEKMRKRYKCRRIDNNRLYLVNALAEVKPVEHT